MKPAEAEAKIDSIVSAWLSNHVGSFVVREGVDPGLALAEARRQLRSQLLKAAIGFHDCPRCNAARARAEMR